MWFFNLPEAISSRQRDSSFSLRQIAIDSNKIQFSLGFRDLHFSDCIFLSSLRTIYSSASVCLRLLSLVFFRLHISQLFADGMLVGEHLPQAFECCIFYITYRSALCWRHTRQRAFALGFWVLHFSCCIYLSALRIIYPSTSVRLRLLIGELFQRQHFWYFV